MEKKVALYIHIPFCKSKCLYCDFPSFCGMESSMLDYCKALSKEINSIKDVVISSIFIGGGTPTYLSLEGWKLIKSSIDNLNTTSEIEFTVEGNPGTFEQEKLTLLKEMGVNRLSIGLQAFQDDLLRSLGRIHDSQDFIKSFQMARLIGFDNINIDLMFGLPSQSLSQWEETLKQIIKLKPEHISSYSLIIEDETPLKQMYEEEKITIPSEDEEREMYDLALELLNKSGYIQYEISNFSKANMQCKHNLVYWSMDEYIGCGAGAHSYIDGKRYSNEIIIHKYISSINAAESAVTEAYINTEKDDMEEFVFMGLRKTEGISIIEFNNKFNRDINLVYGKVITKYVEKGLIEVNNNRMYLTSKGMPLANIVMSEFILDKLDK